ncbi:MAG: reverse transcriptase family protein, partial [Candidatus Thiodiazotropha sp.]
LEKPSSADSEEDICSGQTFARFKWNEEKKNEFLYQFRNEMFTFFSVFNASLLHGVNTALQSIIDLYQTCANCMLVRSRGQRKSQPPWWDKQCQILKRDKMSSLHGFRYYNSVDHLREYKMNRNRFKNVTRSKKANYLKKQKEELINSRSNPTKFWKLIKQTRASKKTYDKIKGSEWHEHFRRLLYDDSKDDISNFECTESENELFQCPISDAEVRKGIMKLKSGKSGGPDGIVSEMLRNTLLDICPVLVVLFNKIFDLGDFPEQWGGSIICPIHKKGPVDDPNNFRGISLIDVLNKVFTSILNERIKLWADSNQMIDEAQAGFRKGYSAIDNLFCLQAMAQKYLSKKNGRFYCLFVDFSKAFDTIDHAKLLTCLADRGVGGKLLKVLKSMYCKLRSCVQNNGRYTDFFTCNVGTRQGCILSPVLFSLFINELITDIKSKCSNGIFITQDISDIYALLYADDIANCADTVISLQSQLNLVESFCARTGMRVNLNKTKIIVFRNGGFLRRNEKWFYQGQRVETVSSYKYMGLLFTPKLSWTKAKEELAAQAKRALFTLYNVQNKLGSFSHVEAFKLFDTMIVPILTYAAEIWGYEYSTPIEKVHDRFCSNFLKLPRYTFAALSRGDVGRMPLCYTYFCKTIKYWIRLTRMNNSRYPRQCYIMLKRLDDVDRVTWVTKVRNLLCRFGFGYAWYNQDVGNEKQFMCMFKQRLRDNLIQDW